jgi:hypothetical protein
VVGRVETEIRKGWVLDWKKFSDEKPDRDDVYLVQTKNDDLFVFSYFIGHEFIWDDVIYWTKIPRWKEE